MPQFHLYQVKDGVWLESRIGQWASTEVWAVNKGYTNVDVEFICEYYWDQNFYWDKTITASLGSYGSNDSAVYLGVVRDFGESGIRSLYKYGIMKVVSTGGVSPPEGKPKPTPTPSPKPTPTPTPTPTPPSDGGGGGGIGGMPSVRPGDIAAEARRKATQGWFDWIGDDLVWTRIINGQFYKAFVKDIKSGPVAIGSGPGPHVWSPDGMRIFVRAPVPAGFKAVEVFEHSFPIPGKPPPKPTPPKHPPPRVVPTGQPQPPPKPR